MRTRIPTVSLALVAAVLTMTACSPGSGPPSKSLPPEPTSSRSAPTASPSPRAVTPKVPVEIRQVTAETPGACAAGAKGLPSLDKTSCFQVGDGFTVRHLRDLRSDFANNAPIVSMVLTSDDEKKFADLTTRVHKQQDPRNRVAMIVDGTVVSAPLVYEPITSGGVQIAGPFTAEDTKDLVSAISGS